MPKISELPVLQKLGNTGAAPDAARSWDFAYTWNAAGTTFVAQFFNITNTASAAGSLLADWQVGAVSQFSVSKAGLITTVGGFDYKPTTSALTLTGATGAPTLTAVSSGEAILRGGAWWAETAAATRYAGFGSVLGFNALHIASTCRVNWSSSTDPRNAGDTGLYRNAARVLEVNNGTPGTFGDLKLRNTILTAVSATAAAAPTIASAATIAPTVGITFISGTTAIDTITAPSPISAGGGTITLVPTGIFTWTTAGNIALAGTAVVSKALTMTFDVTTTKWYPSYTA